MYNNNNYVYYQWRIQDFPEEGAPTPQGGRQHTILPKFPKNCMKLKEFGPPGGRASKILLCRSATDYVNISNSWTMYEVQKKTP